MKRLFLILFIISLSSLFIGCNELGREINTQFIDFNIEEDYSKIEKSEYLNNYSISFNINNDLSSPLIIVQNGEALGVYSILKNNLIFNFKENISIDFIVNYYFPNYFRITYSDNESELYDYNGNVILQKGSYIDLKVDLTRVKIKNNWIYQETISYASNDETVTLKYNSINDIINRQLITEDSFVSGDKITFVPKGRDLEEIGLPGYYAIDENENYVQIYNQKNQLISTINLNFDYQYFVSFAGFIIYQKVLLLDADEKEYDYAVEVNNDLLKYDLITNRLNIKTGEIDELDVNFIISDGESCKDKKGIYNYANVQLKFIENKRLQPTQQFIIDGSCDIIYNFSNAISLDTLIRLDSERYFDYNSNKLYDNKMNLLFDFKNNDNNIEFHSFDFGNKLIKCSHNGKLGFINYDLEVIIPFEYDEIGDYFISNYIFGEKDDANYLVYINNQNIEISQLKVENAPLIFKVDEINNLYYYQIYTYENQKVLEFYSKNIIELSFNRTFYEGVNYYSLVLSDILIDVNVNLEKDLIFTIAIKEMYG